ncbi:unnamed protein product [Cochlearia groenlandica]
MLRRPRPGGGRHPPPLAPTVSNFKPRAQWSNSGSTIFLYVNLPGFYRDQIEIKKDERTRSIQIQGQRPLSTHTRARFNEAYRVPESCDMSKLNTSFSHGLLTIEFPAMVKSEKPEKAVQDQGKTVQKPNQEESRGFGLTESILGRKKPTENVGTSQEKTSPMANKEEPKTYKSVVEGKRPVPIGSQEKSAKRVKEGETSPSFRPDERAKEEKVVERKEAAQMGQQMTVKEEETRSKQTNGVNLKNKVLPKEEKLTERKKAGEIGQKKTAQKVKEEGKIGSNLEPKVHAKPDEGNGELGLKLEEKGNIGLGQKKEDKQSKQAVSDLKNKEKVAKIAREVNANGESNHDKNHEKMIGDKASEDCEREIQETVKQKKLEEAMEPRRVDSSNHIMKEESAQGGEDKDKIVKKSSESGPLLVGEESHNISLVNVGAAALVIMGFGAYVFVPLVKMFY